MTERDQAKSWEDKVMFIGFYLISLTHCMSNISCGEIHYRNAVCLLSEFGSLVVLLQTLLLQTLLMHNLLIFIKVSLFICPAPCISQTKSDSGVSHYSFKIALN